MTTSNIQLMFKTFLNMMEEVPLFVFTKQLSLVLWYVPEENLLVVLFERGDVMASDWVLVSHRLTSYFPVRINYRHGSSDDDNAYTRKLKKCPTVSKTYNWAPNMLTHP